MTAMAQWVVTSSWFTSGRRLCRRSRSRPPALAGTRAVWVESLTTTTYDSLRHSDQCKGTSIASVVISVAIFRC